MPIKIQESLIIVNSFLLDSYRITSTLTLDSYLFTEPHLTFSGLFVFILHFLGFIKISRRVGTLLPDPLSP